jgi:hypothetical protein
VPGSTFSRTTLAAGAGLIVLMTAGAPAVSTLTAAQNDLDAFMQQVVARRDDNWKKLQQYVLDEREEFDLRGPGNLRMWGEQRDYTWFIRDGFFVRSPLKFNGVTIGEDERRKAEDEYLRRAQRRDARAGAAAATPPDTAGAQAAPAPEANDADTLNSVDGLIRQSRQPQFVSSAYFLRFKFDEGTYALVGREQFEGRDVLRVEYYPTKLFSNDRPGARGGDGGRGSARRRPRPEPGSKEDRQQAELRRVLNKVALITLWIEPASHQIVKYTFDNVDFDFLPVPWLVKVDTVKASMTMGQPFPDVWLPRGIEVNVGLTLANGEFAFRESVSYHDYREATVTTKVGIPGAGASRKR